MVLELKFFDQPLLLPISHSILDEWPFPVMKAFSGIVILRPKSHTFKPKIAALLLLLICSFLINDLFSEFIYTIFLGGGGTQPSLPEEEGVEHSQGRLLNDDDVPSLLLLPTLLLLSFVNARGNLIV